MKAMVGALGATLLLTGCGPTFPTIDGEAISAVVAQVRGYTVKICSYLPTNDTVVKIITAGDTGETAYNIAKSICDAVTATEPPLAQTQMQEQRAGDKTSCPMVAGVCIEGQFIKEKHDESGAGQPG